MRLTLSHEETIHHVAMPDDLRAAGVPESAIVEAAQRVAVEDFQTLAAHLRSVLSGASDPYKAAIYNQRAAYGRAISEGTPSEAMLGVARSECLRLAALDREDARAKGLVAGDDDDEPDVLAIARLWARLDERLAGLAAEIDRREAEAVIAIGRRRTIDGVEEALEAARMELEAWAAVVA